MSTAIFSKGNIRRLLAASFLVFLLAEFGSHGLICSGESAADGRSISATDSGHEDPCATLIQCGYDQNQRQPTTLSHDAMQHNALFDRMFELSVEAWLLNEPPILSDADDPLFRPPDPPFHPPKFS